MLARDAGLTLLETQALSVLVFVGSAQVSAGRPLRRGRGRIAIAAGMLVFWGLRWVTP